MTWLEVSEKRASFPVRVSQVDKSVSCSPLAGPGCCGVTGVLSGEGGIAALPNQEESFLKVTCCSSLRAVTTSDLVRLSARAALNIK